MKVPANFYRDPNAPGHLRYWDGERWTMLTQLAPRRTAVLVVVLVIYSMIALAFVGLVISTVHTIKTNYISSCISTDMATWSLVNEDGKTEYSGTITNTCSSDLTNILVGAVGYDSSNVQVDECSDLIAQLAAGSSAQVSCSFYHTSDDTDQVTSAKIYSMH